MNRSYRGQSQKSVASCTGITIPGEDLSIQFDYPFNVEVASFSYDDKRYSTRRNTGWRNHLQSTSLLKGTINKRPGFSKPGLL